MTGIAIALCVWAGAFAYAVWEWGRIERGRTEAKRLAIRVNENMMLRLNKRADDMEAHLRAWAQANTPSHVVPLNDIIAGHANLDPRPQVQDDKIVRPPFGQKKPEDTPPPNGGAA
ncbi:MAG: hypothetical protein AB7P35_17895 [Hyphomonadaceae bacterium]